MSQLRFLIILTAALGFALPVDAHRLDEYLQATRIDISSNRVDLEMDLTPGVEVASAVLSLIDSNHDGNITKEEGEAYAKRLLKAVILKMDKRRQRVKLRSVHYPPVSEMKSGTGVIHLKASATYPPVMPGPHHLYFQNQHQTNLSVYLINAYVPKSPTIEITHQQRDVRQTQIQIDFTLANSVAGERQDRPL